MLKGTIRWDNSDAYYSQVNNPTETFLRTIMSDFRGWLESCGPTAAVNCLASMGVSLGVRCPGVYTPQPEEVLMDYFNDPRNHPALNAIREVPGTIPKNRVPQYYPRAVRDVFDYRAAFLWGAPWDGVATAVYAMGRAVQVCLRSPSHYVAVVAYDKAREELVYHDSWGTRFPDGSGFARRMGRVEFEKNVQPYHIVYGFDA